MNIEIDTINEIIVIKGSVKLDDLFRWLMTHMPDFEWKKYTLYQTNPWIVASPSFTRGIPPTYTGDNPF